MQATQHAQGSHFSKEKGVASGGTQTHDTLHSRQSALPAELPCIQLRTHELYIPPHWHGGQTHFCYYGNCNNHPASNQGVTKQWSLTNLDNIQVTKLSQYNIRRKCRIYNNLIPFQFRFNYTKYVLLIQ